MRVRNILILASILLLLGVGYYFTSRPQPPPPPNPRIYAWEIDMEQIKRIEIALPFENRSQAFIKERKGDEFPWYFDNPQRSKVDTKRWGGGIPLLLSGPGVDRIIAENATPEKLTELGLTQPRMKITLSLDDGNILYINVGDSTPNGKNFYIQAPGTTDVATVDIAWYEVIARLVTEPPYASS